MVNCKKVVTAINLSQSLCQYSVQLQSPSFCKLAH